MIQTAFTPLFTSGRHARARINRLIAASSAALLTTCAVHAQCPFAVASNTTTATTAATLADALLLTRAARDASSVALTAGTGSTRGAEAILTDTDNTALRLDVDGSGVFDTTDAAIITRYLLGFRGDALLPGGAGAHATRSTSAQIQAFIDGGCTVKKRLIELGWDSPTPAHIRANILAMEERVFSGTVARLTAGTTLFNKTAYPDAKFTQDRADLAATTFTKLTDNFVSVQSASADGWGWFSDSDWAAAQANAVNFAKTAKAGRFKGLVFDPEPYGNNAWQYSSARYPTQPFASVQAKVRQRGAAFLSAVQAEMPNIKIMLLFGASIVKLQTEEYSGGVLQNAEWALWPSFIDGMLDVIGPQVQLIDGDELSYYYTTALAFDNFRANKRASHAYVSPENRSKYDRHVRVAHAVFVDGTLNLWNSSRFIGHYFASDAERLQWIEFTTFHGLRASDEYLWVYNENMDWWASRGSGVQLPAGLEAKLANAEQKINAAQALGAALPQTMVDAADVYQRKIFIGGRISDASGAAVADVTVDTGSGVGGLGDVFCGRVDSAGNFSCFFPRNSSFTITPSKVGYTFSPASRTFINQPFGQADQNFVAIKN